MNRASRNPTGRNRQQTLSAVVAIVFGVAISLTTPACAGPATSSSLANPLVARATPSASTPSSTRKPPGPSAELRRLWPASVEDASILYADLATLRSTEQGRGLWPVLQSAAKLASSLSVEQRACIQAALESVREVLVGVTSRGKLAIALFSPETMPLDARECLTGRGAAQVRLGDEIAWRIDDWLLVARRGLLFVGDAGLVDEARRSSGRVPEHFAFAPDEHIAARGPLGRGSIIVAPDRFSLSIEGEMGEREAAKLVDGFASAQNDGELGAVRERVARAFVFRRDGGHVSVGLTLAEGPADQSRDIAVLADAVLAAAGRFVATRRIAEARITMGEIAKAHISAFYAADGKMVPNRKLVSMPPVPRTVPRGVTVLSSASDWAGWASIGFSLSAAQRFQFEVVAAPDGKSMEIVARGDLDGNGKTSLLVLRGRIEEKKLVFGPKLEENDAFE